MKHARKTLLAVALFGLAPLVGCDQGGQVEDASAPDTTTTPDREPPARDTTTPPPTEPETPPIDDPSGG